MSASQAKTPIWHKPAFLPNFFQLLLLSCLIFTGWWLYTTVTDNLEKRGIVSGFSFLQQRAGIEISFKLIAFDSDDSIKRAYLVALMNTLLVSFSGIILAIIVGFIMGVARLSSNWIVSKVAMVYVEFFRNIPLLLQIFFWFFAVFGLLPNIRDAMQQGGYLNGHVFISDRGITLPQPVLQPSSMVIIIAIFIAIAAAFSYRVYSKKRESQTGRQLPVFFVSLALIIGLPLLVFIVVEPPIVFDLPKANRFNLSGGMTLSAGFLAMLLALGIYTGAFIAEIVRAGINSVAHGQREAAHALGLKPSLTLRLVIIPQALRVIIPPLSSECLTLAKNSSLAAAIAYAELVSVFNGPVLEKTGQAIECVGLVMLSYLVISLLISALMNWYNKGTSLVER